MSLEAIIEKNTAAVAAQTTALEKLLAALTAKPGVLVPQFSMTDAQRAAIKEAGEAPAKEKAAKAAAAKAAEEAEAAAKAAAEAAAATPNAAEPTKTDVTQDDVKDLILKVASSTTLERPRDKASAILARFGAERVTKLLPEHYAAAAQLAQQTLDGTVDPEAGQADALV